MSETATAPDVQSDASEPKRTGKLGRPRKLRSGVIFPEGAGNITVEVCVRCDTGVSDPHVFVVRNPLGEVTRNKLTLELVQDAVRAGLKTKFQRVD